MKRKKYNRNGNKIHKENNCHKKLLQEDKRTESYKFYEKSDLMEIQKEHLKKRIQ
jgi:hypothetical protein